MSDNEQAFGTLESNADGSFIGKLHRNFEGHTSDAVWAMLVEPNKMAQWLASGTIDPHVGGRAHIDFTDSRTVIDSKVTAYLAPQVLEYSWSSGTEPKRPLRWALAPTSNGTQLALTVHAPAGEDAAKACAGFEGHLDMLAAALEGVPIQFPFETFLAARAAYGQSLS